MCWRRMIISIAAIVTLLLAVNLWLRLMTPVNVLNHSYGMDVIKIDVINRFILRDIDLAETCYPFVWQHTKREKLRLLLHEPVQMPAGTDEMALARFVQFAEKHQDEKTFREGILREPHNALYHYLLADYYVKQSLRGKEPKTNTQNGVIHYDYTITNRDKLDEGMRELAIGLQLPFQSHRNALIRARLAAFPPTRNFDDHLKDYAVLGSANFPEYAQFRRLAQVNGFYLSLLLSEGKRSLVKPFLYTGERMVVQISNDSPLVLQWQFYALAIGTIAEKNDAYICRAYGLNSEADMIMAHQELVIGKLRAWSERRYAVCNGQIDTFVTRHAGILPQGLLLVFYAPLKGVFTPESLRPSRLAEYVMVEEGVATGLCLFAFMLLVVAGLKYWRWKLATGATVLPAPNIAFTRRDWLRIIGFGLLAPFALYLLYITNPSISGREYNIHSAAVPFYAGICVFVLWVLIVPTTLAAGILWQRSITVGLIVIQQPWYTRLLRLATSVLTAIWCELGLGLLLLPISWGLLVLTFAHFAFYDVPIVIIYTGGIFWLVLSLLPAVWLRKQTAHASFHLAMARNMMMTYAIMTLFFALLFLVGASFERHYVRTDPLMNIMQQGDDFATSKGEGQVALRLRQEVRDGATTLGIPWK